MGHPFNVCGPGRAGPRVVPTLIGQCLDGAPINRTPAAPKDSGLAP